MLQLNENILATPRGFADRDTRGAAPTAGGVMLGTPLVLPQDATVAGAIDVLRAHAGSGAEPYYLYVADAGRRLAGVVSMRDLVLARSTKSPAQVMGPGVG